MTTTYTEWALVFAGFTVGISSTQATNIENECIGGVFTAVDSAWNVYYYMDKYMQSEEETHMAWGITYLVKGFESAYNTDCSSIESDVNGWLEDAANWFSSGFSNSGFNAEGSQQPIVKQDDSAFNETTEFTDMVFDVVYEVL